METQAQMSKKAHDAFASMGLQGKEELVERAKAKAAELWDIFDEATNEPGTEGGRMYAVAKTNLEQAVMWFVKGVSRSKAN